MRCGGARGRVAAVGGERAAGGKERRAAVRAASGERAGGRRCGGVLTAPPPNTAHAARRAWSRCFAVEPSEGKMARSTAIDCLSEKPASRMLRCVAPARYPLQIVYFGSS